MQQLLIWLPEDTRLYWLLGELYNAQGGAKNIQSARMIFEELAGFNGLGVRAAELAEHRKDLLNYKSPELEQPTAFDLDRKLDQEEKKQAGTALASPGNRSGLVSARIAGRAVWHVANSRNPAPTP